MNTNASTPVATAEQATIAAVSHHSALAEQQRRVLEQRARELSRPPEPPAAPGTSEVLTFTLARETYAIETQYVIAVFRLGGITPLPGATPPLYGVTGWRGDVLTILDLRLLLGSTVTALDDLARVVVLGDRRAAFGILADTLGEIMSVTPDDLFSLEHERLGMGALIRGVTRDAVLLLDGQRLLQRQSGSTSTPV
jgi:purine-binding chemotaxis protein CheW